LIKDDFDTAATNALSEGAHTLALVVMELAIANESGRHGGP